MPYRHVLFIITFFALLFGGCKAPKMALTGDTAYLLKEYSASAELLTKEFGSEKDPVKKKDKADRKSTRLNSSHRH